MIQLINAKQLSYWPTYFGLVKSAITCVETQTQKRCQSLIKFNKQTRSSDNLGSANGENSLSDSEIVP